MKKLLLKQQFYIWIVGTGNMIKVWIDDIREVPEGYTWCRSTNNALRFITQNKDYIELIDIDHDAGDYQKDGGDFISVLKELERLSRNPRWAPIYKDLIKTWKFRLHSANPVGVQNMRAILQANGWKEVF